jgi:hypothetical protein
MGRATVLRGIKPPEIVWQMIGAVVAAGAITLSAMAVIKIHRDTVRSDARIDDLTLRGERLFLNSATARQALGDDLKIDGTTGTNLSETGGSGHIDINVAVHGAHSSGILNIAGTEMNERWEILHLDLKRSGQDTWIGIVQPREK